MSTYYYARPVTTIHNQLARLTDAYRHAGLKPPTRAQEIRDTIRDGAQSVTDTAARLALEALTSEENPGKWYARALEEIREAQARETLSQAFAQQYELSLRRALPGMLKQGAETLKPHADNLLESLTANAQELPEHRPLDPEAALAAEAGIALKETRDALSSLGLYSAIFETIISDGSGAPPALTNLLPIIALPTAEIETVTRDAETGRSYTLNKDKLTGTHTIRQLGRDATEHGPDLTLVRIARGTYPGVTLTYATRGDYRDRLNNARNAYQRQRAAA